MVKLTKDISGCSGGEVYPQVYKAGTECPEDLLQAAMELGAVDDKAAKKAAAEAAKAAEDEAARLAKEAADAERAEEEAAAKAAEEAATKADAGTGA